MGLDTTHGCWHGPYSAFTRFRNALGRAAGYSVAPVTYDSGFTSDTVSLEWDAIEAVNPGCYAGEWQQAQRDPLVYLIAHSDCDGVIHPAQGLPLAIRLEELSPAFDASLSPCDAWMTGKAVQFAAGLRLAAARGETVEFR